MPSPDIPPFVIRSYPIKNVPLSIRPVVLVLFATWLLILGVLGLAPLRELPINDKVLHFFGMGIATFLLYFIIDVPDSSRRIWYYRRAPMILTLSVGFLGGGILSEVVQGYLPYKTFQYGDIIANLLGSTIAYLIAHTILLHSRQRAQLSRLYLPISSDSSTPFPTRVRSESMDTEMGAWEYQHHVSGPGTGEETGKLYAGSRAFDLGDDEEDEVSDSRR